jgi:hypothetical protein
LASIKHKIATFGLTDHRHHPRPSWGLIGTFRENFSYTTARAGGRVARGKNWHEVGVPANCGQILLLRSHWKSCSVSTCDRYLVSLADLGVAALMAGIFLTSSMQILWTWQEYGSGWTPLKMAGLETKSQRGR